MDPSGNILDWSSGAERILGITAAHKGCSLQVIFPSDEHEAFTKELREADEGGETRDERWHVRKDGTRFWAFGILSSLRDADGMKMGYVQILRDLTDWKLAQDERSRLTKEIERANSVLEQMVAALAHDIRAPLTAILGWTRLRTSGGLQNPAEVDHAFEVIERNARKQLDLMEALLELARVKSGRVEPHFALCDAAAIVREALDTVRPTAMERNIQIEVLACQRSLVVGNPTWLTQIFTNLLQNAVKFTPAGGFIRICCRRDSDSCSVEISDTGIGISPDLLPEIFEPFKRGTTRAAGAGLGLAIVRELVDRQGGRVFARSEGVAKGATFTVELPLAASADASLSRIS
jgi:PAS domain S-box-containing protein